MIDSPQRIAGGSQIVLGIHHAQLVTPRDEHQRAVELVYFVQKDRYVHRARFGHLIVVQPRTVVLVPLPHVAVESHLAVDLELMHVHRFAEELDDRIDHARMAREFGERIAVHVRREVRANNIAGLFPYVLGTPLGIYTRHFLRQHCDLFGLEQAGKEEIAVAIELRKLLCGKFHGLFSSRGVARRLPASIGVPGNCTRTQKKSPVARAFFNR